MENVSSGSIWSSELNQSLWDRRLYRGNKVYVLVNEEGKPCVDQRGLVTIRYKVDDDREYNAHPRDIVEITAEALANIEKKKKQRSRKSRTIRIYTDGGARPNPGPAGAGIVLEADGYRREISLFLGRATNSVAELSAVREALIRIRDRKRPLQIHVDSTYVLGVLTGKLRVGANKELIDEILVLIGGFPSVRFKKVPAHADDAMNNLADRLAQRGRESGQNDERLIENAGLDE